MLGVRDGGRGRDRCDIKRQHKGHQFCMLSEMVITQIHAVVKKWHIDVHIHCTNISSSSDTVL